MNCPLCLSSQVQWQKLLVKGPQDYALCLSCDLIFMHSEQFLSSGAEKARYEEHNNQDTEQYRNFFKPLMNSISNHRSLRGLKVLDFGSGPTPVFSRMLQEAGAEVRSYDPFFHPDESVFSGIYDCIVMVEVIEHLHHPRQELLRLKSLLSPQGFFAIQTKYHSGLNQEFANWGYRRDPTHVAFFSLSTMQFVANLLAAPVVTREGILQPRN